MRTLVIICIAVVVATDGHVTRGQSSDRPAGSVRLAGRAVADANGPFNALGASLFWLAWGFKHDRAHLERNLKFLADAGVDYVRALGDVGPGGWEDREIDPRWPDYRDVLAGATDLAYDKYGLRVQWTIFGGSDHVPTPADRARLVDLFGELANGRAHKVFALELANEYSNNQFGAAGGAAEVRSLGGRLASATAVLVALSDPRSGTDAACELYRDSGADIATVHYSRSTGTDGPWAPVWQPWTWPASPAVRRCAGELPVAINNEPIGPQSSVNDDDDPLRLTLGFVTTFVAGNAAYVFHAGPGIRGGGRADLERKRSASYPDVPGIARIAEGFRSARRYLPVGLANWTRHDLRDHSAPIRILGSAIGDGTLARGYVASHGHESVAVLLGMKKSLEVALPRPGRAEIINPLTGSVVATHSVRAGERFRIDPRPRADGDGLILRATYDR